MISMLPDKASPSLSVGDHGRRPGYLCGRLDVIRNAMTASAK